MPESTEAQRLLGQRVRERRLALGISQERLAHAAGVHTTFVSAVERAARGDIRLENLLRLADALLVDPSELVKGMRSTQPQKERPDVAGKAAAVKVGARKRAER